MTPYRKAVTALVLTITGAVAAGLIVGQSALWVGVVVAALTTAGVYVAPNSPGLGDGGQVRRYGIVWVLVVVALVLGILWLLGIPVRVGGS